MGVQSIIGPIIHCDESGDLVIHENVQIDIRDGKIENVHLNPDTNNVHKSNVKRLENGQFLIPGLIDGHIHAVQLPNLGLGYDKPLLDWLSTYTFPLEKKYEDAKFADRVFDAVVKRTLKMGTTTACYYASLHGKASLILAEKAAIHGQRALVGKVNMNNCPAEDYCESSQDASIQDTEKFIEEVDNINNPLVRPIITPRFALSCSLELMKNLAQLARTKNLHVQTHISENKEEIQAVKDIFPEFSSYAEVYDAAGLLTKKTVLAHGIYLSDNELNIIHDRKSAVIHCPSSNTCLKSGLCDVRRLQAANVKVGLGTDVSGGNLPSILDVMRAALQVSTHLSLEKPGYDPLNYKDVFYLGTLGGAEALDMNDKVGNFKPGKEFDALVIDLAAPNSVLDNLQEYTLDEKLQRLIYSGDDRNVVEVYVSGHRVM
ncbi:guanine deaminase [Nasonia vitripennis]|uniref:Guanine deaminase n=1 Tax=Nasonia vitripennis TaxID=7425 RepID=A0A7M7LRT1_NASVI|nr:guanine deaminase [Nasonia vitripennis]XP_003424237.1 guanine deaminase [Nasonia vitripennis]XP_008213597.1 guanine deaminase [Nasonia vitripennis]XP_008213598.1 guanine deaminase [Nasonia vitripennis]XP_008213599.1 guanine deaminase [Nasonia vitripennis]XP_032454441.1 guanine deaminase [Nasonia vitripennis]